MTAWTEFLSSQGATLGDGVVADFGDAAAELAAAANQTVVADLSQYGLIGLAGEDAQTFLHGQITNDLRNLNENAAVFAGYLSAKGRMLANFLVMKRAGDLLVMLPEALREPIQKRLSMFILRSKVKARDAGGEWVRFGVNGPAVEAVLTPALGYALPEGLMSMAQGEQSFVLRLGDQRFDVFVQPDAAVALWQALCSQCRPVGAPAWDWLMVQAGVPMVLPQTQDHFVPQMANMEILGGVSFNKGCYPGQEIVARTHYLGQAKRGLVRLRGRGLQAGQAVEARGQAVGSIACTDADGTDALAVLSLDAGDGLSAGGLPCTPGTLLGGLARTS